MFSYSRNDRNNAADYTAKSGKFPARVHIYKLFDGQTLTILDCEVSGKVEARRIAAEYEAQCWNF